jgi:hypothetical protein
MNKNEPDPKYKSGEIKEDDLDIGQLLTLIGKGLTGIVNFIVNLFKTLFYWIVLFLLFLRKNFRKMVMAAVIGGLLGAIYQYGVKEKEYESSMTVEPNFGSAVQLYKNIDYYLSLVKQDDFERLASSLNISKEEAESISRIEVNPYSNENQVLISYKNFVKALDSNTVKLLDYKTFAKEIPVESYKYHVIKIVSKDKYIFNKLESPIINSIVQNDYYDKIKTTAHSNLITRKSALENSMIELDSLRSLYKKVLLAESEKETTGTNIFMSENGNNSKEVDIFDKYMLMNEQLIEVNKQLTAENEVINVVSSFNSIGMKVKTWYKNFAALGFLGGFIIMFLFISFKQLDKLLVNFTK